MAITSSQFKTYFARDFSYYSGTGSSDDFVTDDDIDRAIAEAGVVFNASLFSSSATLESTANLYLAAHMLTDNIAAQSGQGGSSSFPTQHKSVGAVMESFAVPEWVLKQPSLSPYATTRYGQKYLSMLFPMLIGNATVFTGATTP